MAGVELATGLNGVIAGPPPPNSGVLLRPPIDQVSQFSGDIKEAFFRKLALCAVIGFPDITMDC